MNTFVTWLNGTGGIFCRHAFWMLVQTGILFGILLLLDRLLRRRIKASLRYYLWLLILLKLLLPVNLALPSGIGYWLPGETIAKVTAGLPLSEPVVSTLADAPAPEAQSSSPATFPPRPEEPVRTVAVQPAAMPAPVSLTPAGALLGLWLLGVVCLGVALVYQVLHVRRLVLCSRGVPETITDLLAGCCDQIGCRRTVAVRQSDAMPSPAVCGLLSPTILLPTSVVEQFDTDRQRAVLLHELGHIRRHDLWVNLFQTILQLFYFYNPFVRLANHWIRRTREQANDEQVLFHLSGRRQDYGNTLIAVAAGAVARPALAMRLIGVAEPKTQLHERITLIMNKPLPKTIKTGALDIAALIIVALLLLPMAAGTADEAANAATGSISREQAVAQKEQIVQTQLDAFNAGDIDTFMSVFTEAPIVLPHQTPLAMGIRAREAYFNGMTGGRQAYLDGLTEGIEILAFDCLRHDMWACGDYVITASVDKYTAKVPSLTYMITELRNYLTVYRVQPDGTLKVYMDAWNPSARPDNAAQLQPSEAVDFHAVPAEPITPAALTALLEKVKQMEIEFHECFNRHELKSAADYYAKDAMLMTLDTFPIRGQAAIESYIIENSKPVEHIDNNHQVVYAEGNASMVIVVNQFGWIFREPASGQLLSIPGKGIHVWQKQPDGTWKIILDLHNTNVPLNG